MGKKNKKSNKEGEKRNKYDEESEYGDISELSVDTADLAGGAEDIDELIVEEPTIEDRAEADRSRIGAAIDGMTEKRGKTRENALLELKHILQLAHSSHEDSLADFSETLDNVLSRSLNAGGMEGAYAANVFAIMFIVLGQSDYGTHVWSRSARKLRSIGSKRDLEDNKATAASGCALFAYSMGLLCCGGENNIDEIEATLTLCTELVAGKLNNGAGGHVSVDVRTVALQSWGLLIGSVSTVASAHHASELLPHVSSILGIEGGEYDVDLRNEAGQTAALMCEIHANARLEAQENREEFFGSGGDVVQWEAIRSSLHRLANESSKRLSKTAKKEQHATFRRFLRSVDEYSSENVSELDKSTPNAIVSFSGGKVTCLTWIEYVKLSCLRKVLGGGLADHLALGEVATSLMMENIEQIDSSNMKNDDGGGGSGGRGKRSTGKRETADLRGKQRSQRQQAKDSFFEED